MIKEITENRAVQYHNPSSGIYVIVSPSTKGSKYQATYFDSLGPIMDMQMDNVEDVVNELARDNYFYNSDEIHYQLKNYDRGVVDELYRSAISRGYRTDNSGDGQRISFGLSNNQTVEAYHDARIGNFSVHDFDELILANKEVSTRVKDELIKNILGAVDKGLDVNNKEVKLNQYLNRFYGIPVREKIV